MPTMSPRIFRPSYGPAHCEPRSKLEAYTMSGMGGGSYENLVGTNTIIYLWLPFNQNNIPKKTKAQELPKMAGTYPNHPKWFRYPCPGLPQFKTTAIGTLPSTCILSKWSTKKSLILSKSCI